MSDTSPRRIRRPVFFPPAFYRRVSALEAFYVPVMVALAWTVWHVPQAQREGVPLYDRMEDIAPLDWWSLFIWLNSAALVIGFVVDSLWVIRISYALFTALWLFVAIVSWQTAPSYVGVVLWGSFALAPALRQGELVVKRQRGIG